MYLIDTDIVIYADKSRPEVLSRLASTQANERLVSIITYAELMFGASKSNRSHQAMLRVQKWMKYVSILPLSAEIAEVFGRLKSELQRKGTPLADFDLLIAATALERDLCLVTNNVRHFGRIEGLRLENWSA